MYCKEINLEKFKLGFKVKFVGQGQGIGEGRCQNLEIEIVEFQIFIIDELNIYF